jgi:RNA polymerase sigma factor (sigma-70 family)
MNRLRSNPLPAVQLREALRSDLDALPDADLLDRFARYADHPAFEVLVRRYGAMVFGVCRRVLAAADADDAFQAAFLVLIRRAQSLRGGRLGPWLYGVAYRVALKARSRAARLAAYRTEAADMIPDPAAPPELADWLPILDAELNALPGKYRDPLVLCELHGASRAEAAKQLGVPEGTLSSRLARGRDLLRKRLLKHGTLLPAGGLAALFSANGVGRATVPAALLARTSELAKVATGAAPAGAVPAGAARLTDEVLKGMFLTKLRLAGGALAILALAAVGLTAAALPGDAPGVPGEGKGGAKGGAGVPPGATPIGDDLLPVKFADKGAVLPDRDALQGLWVLEKFDLDVKGVNAAEVKEVREAVGKMQMLVAGDVWWGMMGGPGGNIFPQRAVLDPKKNPKWIDWHGWGPTGPRSVQRCIYELDGDRLRVCVSGGNDESRPAEFAASDADAPLAVMAFRRGKTPPAAGEPALVGTWAGEPVEIKGGPEEPVRRFTPCAEILDNYLFALADGPSGSDWIGGKYTVDATKNPKWIDVDLAFPRDGGKVPKLYGCYEVADGRVKLVLGAKRATRPLEFKNEGDVLFYDLKAAKELPTKPVEAPPPKPKPTGTTPPKVVPNPGAPGKP